MSKPSLSATLSRSADRTPVLPSGIPDEVKGKLFTRFERGMARGRGEGLGLFIVRTLVERYGGKVWADDRVPGNPEEGAAFRFTLKKA